MSNITALSSPKIIHEILSTNTAVKNSVTDIYPVMQTAVNAKLPYIVMRRSGMSQDPVKGNQGPTTVIMQITVYAAAYGESLRIAENVRAALDNVQGVHYCTDFGVSFSNDFGGGNDVLTMRSCMLTDSQEVYVADAFAQNLVFTIKIY